MYKRRFITAEENAAHVNYNISVGVRHIVLREKSIVDEFYQEVCKPYDDNLESISFVDPIVVLYNQERLDNLGTMGVKAFLDSLQQRESSLSDLRSKVSDDDLLSMIKSRHLQSPSEITAWCRYIENNIEAFHKEVQEFVKQQQQQTVEPSESSQESQTE